MGGTNRSTAGRRYRRARRLRHGRRGVVAVIGTLLALLVFFALFGIFLTQYVPLWMTDNESLLTAQSSTSFATFKSVIDQQYALGGPQSVGTPFVISSNGVPLIAQPTEGTLLFLPNTCPGAGGSPFYSAGSTPKGAAGNVTNPYGQPITPSYCVFQNISMSVGPGGIKNYGLQLATGTLQLVLPNRYYTPETFYFENDAVVQSQSTGYQVMAFPPPLNITYVGGNTSVTSSFLQLYGNSSTVFGQGSEEVYSQLKYDQVQTSNGGGSPFTFTYEIGTQYPCAWVPYLYKLVTQSGLPSTAYKLFAFFGKNPASGSNPFQSITLTPTYSGSCFNTNGATTLLSFQLTSVNYAQVYVAGVQITMGIGST
ncbi:MAG TPA: hypothetical protein VMC82_04140 [Thermoplasmata archaeon]|nr:hypothetical protein [Thermoplasmata archaeon]